MYNMTYDDCLKGKKTWVSSVKKLLCENGFNEVFENPSLVNESTFVYIFKQRLCDCFVQEWYNSKSSNSMLLLYNHVKETFGYENYLDIYAIRSQNCLARFRVSAHSLRIKNRKVWGKQSS